MFLNEKNSQLESYIFYRNLQFLYKFIFIQRYIKELWFFKDSV
jgi:hypothetical protein